MMQPTRYFSSKEEATRHLTTLPLADRYMAQVWAYGDGTYWVIVRPSRAYGWTKPDTLCTTGIWRR